jgi:hypothetical protein
MGLPLELKMPTLVMPLAERALRPSYYSLMGEFSVFSTLIVF